MRYLVLICQELGGSSWSSKIPDLPGCVSCGDTRCAAMESVREAAAAWIEATWSAGRAIPAATSREGDELVVHALGEGWEVDALDLDLPAHGDDDLQPIILSERDLRKFLFAIGKPPPIDSRLSQAMTGGADGTTGNWGPKR